MVGGLLQQQVDALQSKLSALHQKAAHAAANASAVALVIEEETKKAAEKMAAATKAAHEAEKASAMEKPAEKVAAKAAQEEGETATIAASAPEMAHKAGNSIVGGGARLPSKTAQRLAASQQSKKPGTPPGWYRPDKHPALQGKD